MKDWWNCSGGSSPQNSGTTWPEVQGAGEEFAGSANFILTGERNLEILETKGKRVKTL